MSNDCEVTLPKDMALLDKFINIPLREWQSDVFKSLGLRNPYELGNLTIRHEALLMTRNLKGAIVECGTYQGKSLAPLGLLLREIEDSRQVFGVDSFQGFPDEASKHDFIEGQLPNFSKPEYFANANVDQVKAYFKKFKLENVIQLIVGFYEETLPNFPVDDISLLILDCDLYDSYHIALKHLYPKVSSGGWIIFDEYYSPKYPGAKIAIDEFFANKPEKPRLAASLLNAHSYERWYVVKE